MSENLPLNLQRSWGEKQDEIKDKRTFLGIPITFFQDNAEKREQSGNPRDYKVIVPLACLSISGDITPRTHKISNSLSYETQKHPLHLLANLQAPNVVS